MRLDSEENSGGGDASLVVSRGSAGIYRVVARSTQKIRIALAVIESLAAAF